VKVKYNMIKAIQRLFVLSLLLSSSAVYAAPAPSADLQAQLSGPSLVNISTPTVYTATVKNLGRSTATNVKMVVELPITNTSPQVYILGDVSGLNSKCQIIANEISCNMGTIGKGKSASVTYTYKAPVSTKPLTMTNVVSSSVQDSNSANNRSSFTPSLSYPSRPIVSATINNSHCTGTNLTSYFECQLFPSSLSSHDVVFNADFTITLSEPGYTGIWSQSTTSSQLRFEYFEGVDKVAEFNGFAINGANCFDGMTTFVPAGQYVSPYRVCIQ